MAASSARCSPAEAAQRAARGPLEMRAGTKQSQLSGAGPSQQRHRSHGLGHGDVAAIDRGDIPGLDEILDGVRMHRRGARDLSHGEDVGNRWAGLRHVTTISEGQFPCRSSPPVRALK